MNYDYVFDSYAWAEFFDGTPQGKKVKEILEKATAATSVIALAELSDKCARQQRDFEQLHSFIRSKAIIIPLTSDVAIKSGNLKQELRKISRNISLADAIHFQTAKSCNATFVTGDPDFKDVEEGVFFLDGNDNEENRVDKPPNNGAESETD